ncbi:hypothetical protein [uncultured Clostridium sp.]|jgi:hypothetical protein|uniref:hypothetical protein n=1 Tax=uncultured Clostridium sp. TaxID=59620 RepID=UPI00262755DC|nr:hypothetical protein [uncultured Clostridium sp.]
MNLLINEEKNFKITKIIYLAFVIVSIVAWFFLPNHVAVQFSSNGATSVMQKIVYTLIILFAGTVAAFAIPKRKSMYAIGIVFILSIIVIAINLFII